MVRPNFGVGYIIFPMCRLIFNLLTKYESVNPDDICTARTTNLV